MWSLAQSLPLWGRSTSRGAHGASACGAALELLAPAQPCRRARGGMTISCHSSAAAARSLGAVRSAQRLAPLHVVVDVVASSLGAVAVARRSRRRCLRRRAGAPGAGFIVWPRSRRRDARSPLFYSGGSLHFGAVRSARRLALAACGRWRGRFLSGGCRRRAALTAPLPAALRWRSWRRLGRAAVLAFWFAMTGTALTSTRNRTRSCLAM